MVKVEKGADPLKDNGRQQRSWRESISTLKRPQVVSMFFLGISAGLPLLLIFSSLSLWLREAGIDRSAVTYFSWAALGYSFKFVWAPLVDRLSLPILTHWLGRRRGWLMLAQLMVTLSIVAMALTDPAATNSSGLTRMAVAAVLLGFSAATQDIVIDAYRIESAESNLQAMMSASYIAGYRVGMLVAGAGALYLAAYLGSSTDQYSYIAWRSTYLVMATIMLLGLITTLLISEPSTEISKTSGVKNEAGFLLLFACSVIGFISCYLLGSEIAESLDLQLLNYINNTHLVSFVIELSRLIVALIIAIAIAKLLINLNVVEQSQLQTAYIDPVRDFFQRYGFKLALTLLALIGFYRISDIVLGVISNLFYQDLGFSKITIANAVKFFGLLMTLLGGFLGGIMAMRVGVVKILFLGAALSSATNLLFVLLAQVGQDITLLYLVVAADNLSAGLASAAFVAFLSSLTNVSFTATQYAIFSSLMTLLPKVIGGYSGSIVEGLGYETFFTLTALMGLPVLLLIAGISKQLGSK